MRQRKHYVHIIRNSQISHKVCVFGVISFEIENETSGFRRKSVNNIPKPLEDIYSCLFWSEMGEDNRYPF